MKLPRFSRLTHPRYDTDIQDQERNAAWTTSMYRLPGMMCSVCFQLASSHRLRVRVPVEVTGEFSKIQFLPVDEWRRHAPRWANALGLPVSMMLPGATVGPPLGEVIGPIDEEVLHPMPGEIWVSDRVRALLESIHPKGLTFAPVKFVNVFESYSFWELVVHGRSRRIGSGDEDPVLCEVCGRTDFPSPRMLEVDPDRWDGSDFTFVDNNPNIILVTERVADLLAKNPVSNLVTEEV